jgi:HemY protein
MMRLILICLLVLLSLYLGLQLQQEPGYVFISLHHWTVETTLWFSCFAVLILFFLFDVGLRLLLGLIHFPRRLNQQLKKRRIQKAQAKTRQGLIEFSEGYWQQAKTNLIHALPDSDTPLLNYLTAARAAQEMGDSQLRDNYLRQAQEAVPQAKIAVELTQAQLQLANHQWEQALATLRHLQDLAPHHPYVLKLLMHLYEEVKDWSQLIQLLPSLKSKRLLSSHEFQRVEKQAYLQSLHDLIKYNQNDTAISKFFTELPKHLRLDAQLVAAYSRYLIQQNQQLEAETLLRRALSKQFNDELIDLYGQLSHKNEQLAFAESLLKEHANSAALCLGLARLCKAQQLWGKAKVYCEKSLAISPSVAAYVVLGELLEQQNDLKAACIAYRHGHLFST